MTEDEIREYLSSRERRMRVYVWALFFTIPAGIALQLVIEPSVKVVSGRPFTNPNALFVVLLLCFLFVAALFWVGVPMFLMWEKGVNTRKGKPTVFERVSADETYARRFGWRFVAELAAPTVAGPAFGVLYYWRSDRFALSIVFYALALLYFAWLKYSLKYVIDGVARFCATTRDGNPEKRG